MKLFLVPSTVVIDENPVFLNQLKLLIRKEHQLDVASKDSDSNQELAEEADFVLFVIHKKALFRDKLVIGRGFHEINRYTGKRGLLLVLGDGHTEIKPSFIELSGLSVHTMPEFSRFNDMKSSAPKGWVGTTSWTNYSWVDWNPSSRPLGSVLAGKDQSSDLLLAVAMSYLAQN